MGVDPEGLEGEGNPYNAAGIDRMDPSTYTSTGAVGEPIDLGRNTSASSTVDVIGVRSSSASPSMGYSDFGFVNLFSKQYSNPVKQGLLGAGVASGTLEEGSRVLGAVMTRRANQAQAQSGDLLGGEYRYKSALRSAEGEASILMEDAVISSRAATVFKYSRGLAKYGLGPLVGIGGIPLEYYLSKNHSDEAWKRAWFTGLAGFGGGMLGAAISPVCGMAEPACAIGFAAGMGEAASNVSGAWWDRQGRAP
jgi:hypothetical protein